MGFFAEVEEHQHGATPESWKARLRALNPLKRREGTDDLPIAGGGTDVEPSFEPLADGRRSGRAHRPEPVYRGFSGGGHRSMARHLADAQDVIDVQEVIDSADHGADASVGVDEPDRLDVAADEVEEGVLPDRADLADGGGSASVASMVAQSAADMAVMDGPAVAPPAEPPAESLMPVRLSGRELVETNVAYSAIGLPRLVSAEALPDFKRILCAPGADAALRITDAARAEFVAVDLQAGVAIVVATKRFYDTASYATYIKDLERAHIAIQEEMIATEAVIADVYRLRTLRGSSSVPEASRAIGMFRDVIEAAHEYGSSDVHWEYRDYSNDVELRFRVNGDLYSYRKMSKPLVRRALSAAYQDLVERNTNSGETFQETVPQSAMLPIVAKKDLVNVRWQGIPLVGGFDVAMRLLDGNFRHYKVRMPSEMGLEASQLAIIDSLGHVSGGVTVLTGETGSGKTTLLRALAYQFANRDLRKQYAVNQPSEYPQPWLSDISIQTRPDETDDEANRKAAEVVRTIMRGDPDDLTIGEIRDAVMASLVAELALTGHPVRTTLHADSLIVAYMRLAGGRLNLPMDEVGSEKFVNAVGNQKLLPLLCPHCKKPADQVLIPAQLEQLRTKFGLDTSKMACRDEDGCEHCRLPGLFTRAGKVAAGTKGQTLAMELYRPTPEFLDRIIVRDWSGAERVWRQERRAGFADPDMTGKTVYEHALYKASIGLIDPRVIDLGMRSFGQYRVMPDCDGRLPS